MGVLILDDLAQAHLGQLFRHQFLIKQPPLDRGLVLQEGGSQRIEVFLANAFCFLALGFGKSRDFNFALTTGLVKTHVAPVGVIAFFPIVEPFPWTTCFGCEPEGGRQHLLHEQAGGNGLERVVDRLGDGLFRGIGFGNQIGEAGVGLAWGVSGDAANNLHHLRQAGAIAHGQGMFAPNPVKPLLGHAQGNDHVHMVPVGLLARDFERCGDLVPPGGVIIHQVGNAQQATHGCPHKLETGYGIGPLPFPQFLDDVFHLPDLVLGAFP